MARPSPPSGGGVKPGIEIREETSAINDDRS
jgi:hypothetical protein